MFICYKKFKSTQTSHSKSILPLDLRFMLSYFFLRLAYLRLDISFLAGLLTFLSSAGSSSLMYGSLGLRTLEMSG